MAWRNHETHKAETKAVKLALAEAGINAHVTHGHGTAWGWLEIYIGDGAQYGEHQKAESTCLCLSNCFRCQKLREIEEKADGIMHKVTGRHGDHNGECNILYQDKWDIKKGCRIPIVQPE